MDASSIVVVPKCFELSREIDGIPEWHLIQVVSADRADEALDERVRERNQRHLIAGIVPSVLWSP